MKSFAVATEARRKFDEELKNEFVRGRLECRRERERKKNTTREGEFLFRVRPRS